MSQLYTEEEITEVLAQICLTKTPRPNGLPAAFYQKHWKSIKEWVISTCPHILNKIGTIALLNHTYIALIPNNAKPRKMTEFRPIIFCDVIYGIVAKTIVNKLKTILHVVIDSSQSAIIPNRLITDNIIDGYKCLYKIRHSKRKKNGFVALKLDISRTYDRVEWEFLRLTMSRLGFKEKVVNLIISCITTSTFFVIINRVQKGMITP